MQAMHYVRDTYKNLFGDSLSFPIFVNCRPSLRTYDQIPTYQRMNPYILSGYRSFFTVTQAIESIFYWNNETLNIWTHFLGLLVCLYLVVSDLSRKVRDTEDLVFSDQRELYLVIGLLLCYMCTMLFSIIYHTFSCVSEKAHTECFRYDIIGIVFCLTGSFFNGIYHLMGCHPGWCLFYFLLVGLNFFYLLYSLLSNKNLMDPAGECGRIMLFVLWLGTGMLPVVHSAYLEGGGSSPLIQTFVYWVGTQYLVGLGSIFFYLTRIPERFSNGLTDYIGHSHQWWHLGTLLGCVWWHEAVVSLATVRKDYSCT